MAADTEWGVFTQYGNVTIYYNEEQARDELRRNDTLKIREVGEWRPLP